MGVLKKKEEEERRRVWERTRRGGGEGRGMWSGFQIYFARAFSSSERMWGIRVDGGEDRGWEGLFCLRDKGGVGWGVGQCVAQNGIKQRQPHDGCCLSRSLSSSVARTGVERNCGCGTKGAHGVQFFLFVCLFFFHQHLKRYQWGWGGWLLFSAFFCHDGGMGVFGFFS